LDGGIFVVWPCNRLKNRPIYHDCLSYYLLGGTSLLGCARRLKMSAGLTLLEVMIITVVLGVVGAVTVPKFRTMLYQSREGRTKARLGDLRGALAIYYSDNFGLYPLDEGPADKRLASVLVPQYLKAMPEVDLPHFHSKKLSTVQDRFDDNGDWMYSTLHGFVAVNCLHLDTRGEAISGW
jgi:hypothetical protein